ncbi:MerR family transcriptional regulator [Paenibacillus sp. DMB20]|uniref:MerR family transcriptional regulator n=1 Tax=Paenibacillus sp. DMB20 TaxID=1642570 RepID=UPI00062797DA|nr:MerR family transcriptional regulator [Paenibacillus sp. DMB20]KKO54842.1 hypothetical protein XI25_03805 [Paenibacillus sp. DMB20]
MYRVGELSEKTGVTVKTLHYYEKLGLLNPGRHPHTGYRLYNSSDILRLQEISVLKEMGFSLSAIKSILGQQSLSSAHGTREDIWKDAISNQIESLRQKQLRLFRIEQLLQGSLYSIEMNDEVKLDDMMRFIKELQDARPEDYRKWRRQHFTSEEIEKLPTNDLEDPINKEWAKLLKEVRKHVHEPADTPVSFELAEQILVIADHMFQGDSVLMEKYWDKIRPAESEAPNVYGLDAETMAYVDRIVTYYLEQTEGETNNDPA